MIDTTICVVTCVLMILLIDNSYAPMDTKKSKPCQLPDHTYNFGDMLRLRMRWHLSPRSTHFALLDLAFFYFG